MKGNFHVQFLGEGVAATSPPYPTPGWATTQVYPARNSAKRCSDIAPRSSGKENRYNRETFRRNPAGNQSRPEEPGQQPEASLA